MKIEIRLGLIGYGELSAYQVEVLIGEQSYRKRWRMSILENRGWGWLALEVGDWLDQQLRLALVNPANRDLKFTFRNGVNSVFSPIKLALFEVLTGAIQENLQSRFLEGRLP